MKEIDSNRIKEDIFLSSGQTGNTWIGWLDLKISDFRFQANI